MNTKRFVTLAMLALFVFLSCSSGNVRAVYLASPPWDANISNLVKHADLVVLGKVIGRKFIPSERSTLISLKVESVIKGDKAVGDRRLGFTVWGDAGIKTYTAAHTVREFSLNERVLVFLKGARGDYDLFPWTTGKISVKDNQARVPYRLKREVFSKRYNEMRERSIPTAVDLPLDSVIKVAKASIKDYKAIQALEAKVARVVLMCPMMLAKKFLRSYLSGLKKKPSRSLKRNLKISNNWQRGL